MNDRVTSSRSPETCDDALGPARQRRFHEDTREGPLVSRRDILSLLGAIIVFVAVVYLMRY